MRAERVERGHVRITTVTRLEVDFSARSGRDARLAFAGAPLAAMPVEYLTPSVEDRALEVQLLLADQAQHRAPSIPDLMIASVAELAGLIVLHPDEDFELIADVTGQAVERLRQRPRAIESESDRINGWRTTPRDVV
ncbi:MAG: VapC toxin family PIN domain ribonuclease [Geodermatophilaceae bacterium]|nr:VapC toxin family PIN domain ribonuclease [Geodermatophilaceae bacterium]